MITVLIMNVIFWVVNFKTQNYFVISTTQNVYPGRNLKIIKKKGYILSRDSEVTLSHWSRSIELVTMPLIDL
jgi:hypothetical protein